MANRYRNLIYSNAEYTHTYSDFRGVELNASLLTGSKNRLAYSENMYKDYDGDGAGVIESIPGFRCFAKYEMPIHSLFYQRSATGTEDHIIAHVGTSLMHHPISDIKRTISYGRKIASVENKKSFGFAYGRYFYVMDSKRLLQIDDNGVCRIVGDSGALPYVPTTYVSGEPYEQRNLLTNEFKEEYYIGDPNAYLYSSSGVQIVITDPDRRYCSISGITGSEKEVFLPAYVNISGTEYKVVSIEDYAFSGKNAITAVYVAEGIIKIGSYAFAGCTALRTAVISSTVTDIGDHAFYGCSALNTFYLGASVSTVGSGALADTEALKSVQYALNEADLDTIDGAEEIKGKSVIFGSRYEYVKILLPFHDAVNGIVSVTVDEKSVDFDIKAENGIFKAITISFSNRAEATGIKVVTHGILTSLSSDWSQNMSPTATESPYQAIINCTIAEVFDGRIFFSGNPSFPNTVFYTEHTNQVLDSGLYVGRYNYFNDGVGSYNVKSILAVRDMLAVFKEGDDGSGSIFYHKREDSGTDALSAVYPVSYVHSGICASGDALSFLDDPVFVSSEGVMALNRENINYQRNVVCRSHNVNYALLKEDLSKANLCEWLGYLVVGIGDKMFLADSRAAFTHDSGAREYEWFFAKDIGAYTGDSTIYRYSYDGYADAIAHPTLAGIKISDQTIYSQYDINGDPYYYVMDGNIKYSIDATAEKGGGDYSPATLYMSHGRHLFFATSSGHICVFNNDMRGVAPDVIRYAAGFDADEYKRLMGSKIHPYFYSFAGHAPRYVIKTALDNCGIPHLTKSTVKKSLVIKAKGQSSECIECQVSTDGHDPVFIDRFPYVGASFDDFNFNEAPWSVHRYDSYALPEKEKRWIEKQITLSVDSFASPISVYSIAYRYTIKGKIKNNA